MMIGNSSMLKSIFEPRIRCTSGLRMDHKMAYLLFTKQLLYP